MSSNLLHDFEGSAEAEHIQQEWNKEHASERNTPEQV
jgi:hypothetical protein